MNAGLAQLSSPSETWLMRFPSSPANCSSVPPTAMTNTSLCPSPSLSAAAAFMKLNDSEGTSVRHRSEPSESSANTAAGPGQPGMAATISNSGSASKFAVVGPLPKK